MIDVHEDLVDLVKNAKQGTRCWVEIEAEPLVLDYDEKNFLAPVVVQFVEEVVASFNAIREQVKRSTVRRRRSAARALEAGKEWALKRYPAGYAPTGSDHLLNDSGYLRDNISATVPEGEHPAEAQVLAPRGRLDPDDFGRGWPRFLEAVMRRLPTEQVEEIFNRPAMAAVFEAAIDATIQKTKAAAAAARARALRSILSLIARAAAGVG